MKQKQQSQQTRSQHEPTGIGRRFGQYLIHRQNQQQRSWGQQKRTRTLTHIFALTCTLLLFFAIGLYVDTGISHAAAYNYNHNTNTAGSHKITLLSTGTVATQSSPSPAIQPSPSPIIVIPSPSPIVIPSPSPVPTPIPITSPTPSITPTPVAPGVTPTPVTNPGGAGTGPTTPPTATPRASTSTSQTLNGTGGGGNGGGGTGNGGGGTTSTNANGSGGTSSSGSGKAGSSGSSFLVLIIVFIVILVVVAGAILVYLASKQRNKPAVLPPSVPATPLLMDDAASAWAPFSNANMANNTPFTNNVSFAGGMPPAQASMAGSVNPGFYPDATANYGPLSMNGMQEMLPTSQYGNADMPTMAANTMNMQQGQGMFTEPGLTEVSMAPIAPAQPVEQQNVGNLTDPFMDAIIRQAQMGLFFLQGKDGEPGADLGD